MRLTKKELMSAIDQPMCFGSRLVGKKMFAQIIKELCEYKTIEDELGIDLITLFKALKNGIWVSKAKNYNKEKYPYNAGREDLIFFDKEFIYLNCIDELAYEKDFYKGFLALKDYGKTWALTKEELK